MLFMEQRLKIAPSLSGGLLVSPLFVQLSEIILKGAER